MKDKILESSSLFLPRKDRIRETADRRNFLKVVGATGVALAALGLAGCSSDSIAAAALDPPDPPDPSTADTAQQIFTAALIAEDLAITMYYNGLTGTVIQDANLAGPGGSATSISSSGSLANVGYLQGALIEEIAHASLLRTLVSIANPAADPVQTFYFPTGTFDTLENFFPILLALETAFVGAYLAAVHEFAMMGARIPPYAAEQNDASGKPYTPSQIAFFGEVAASILGVEAEHRALARAIPSISPGSTNFGMTNVFPADNVNYEQTDGIQTVYNGSHSAVAALTPFVTPGSGKSAYSFRTALQGAPTVAPASEVQTTGGLPPS